VEISKENMVVRKSFSLSRVRFLYLDDQFAILPGIADVCPCSLIVDVGCPDPDAGVRLNRNFVATERELPDRRRS
jgi:hypothetical protein